MTLARTLSPILRARARQWPVVSVTGPRPTSSGAVYHRKGVEVVGLEAAA